MEAQPVEMDEGPIPFPEDEYELFFWTSRSGQHIDCSELEETTRKLDRNHKVGSV